MNKKWFHLLFVLVIAAVLWFLYRAPQETTARVPSDADHADLKNFARCPSCHGPGSEKPMPTAGDKIHILPDGSLRGDFQKCYMCHKREKPAAE